VTRERKAEFVPALGEFGPQALKFIDQLAAHAAQDDPTFTQAQHAASLTTKLSTACLKSATQIIYWANNRQSAHQIRRLSNPA